MSQASTIHCWALAVWLFIPSAGQATPAVGAGGNGESGAASTAPEEVVTSLYRAINAHDFKKAYSLWEKPPMPFERFVKGYADTAKIRVAVGHGEIEGAAGTGYCKIPTVITATQVDGSRKTFAGCYVIKTTRNEPDEVPHPWRIDYAHLRSAAAGTTPNAELCAGKLGRW